MAGHAAAEKGPSSLSAAQELVINGKSQPSSDGATFTVRNPMTGHAIYECANATVDDYSRAIDTAHEAFESWSATGPSARRLIFLKAADIIESYLEADAPEILSSEVSATTSWVKVNIHATAGIFREAASLATHIRGEIVPADRPGTKILIERQALGGKAPVIVRADADLDEAVNAIVYGALAYSGQVCMSTERAIVHRSVAAELQTRVLAHIAALRCGNHLEDAAVSVSGLFTAASARRVVDLVKEAVDGGAELLAGDMEISGPCGTIVKPHVLRGVGRSARMYHEEIFGPVLMLTEFDTDDEAVELANDSDYSLCASIFSRDIMTAMDLAGRVRAGSCHINGPTVYAESSLPNGGTGGGSGYGRFGGMSGVAAFTETKIITLAKPGLRFSL
ncbi:hypothetical protein MAPG_08150 [Magnaporthiopsis poae ATCC 64411]|uniref:Aldehyde dehydrogenase domain-containing protein n=1 Tax=Magnaporthiopsis poae (strain ATCC 64411 / 73-15) TaxID=644358 RepID=A0A0C4E6K7_MAGP6|nr:hypothetical protein MAPG_08150 [Magnaporthiopsis poae ATCC 64411]